MRTAKIQLGIALVLSLWGCVESSSTSETDATNDTLDARFDPDTLSGDSGLDLWVSDQPADPPGDAQQDAELDYSDNDRSVLRDRPPYEDATEADRGDSLDSTDRAADMGEWVAAGNGVFDIGVVVVTDDYVVGRDELAAAFTLVDEKFRGKTGYGVRLFDVVETTRADIDERRADRVVTERWYFDTHGDNPPEGLIIFLANETSTSFGGYSTTYDLAGDEFCNEFVSPTVGSTRLYVATINWDHRFGRCGYDDDGNHVSDVGIGGECANNPGTPCVDNGDYWICQNQADDPRADVTTFRMFTIVHEFMHPFTGPTGPGFGHHGTDWCDEVTDGNQGTFLDNVGICPIAFQNFAASHHSCD